MEKFAFSTFTELWNWSLLPVLAPAGVRDSPVSLAVHSCQSVKQKKNIEISKPELHFLNNDLLSMHG